MLLYLPDYASPCESATMAVRSFAEDRVISSLVGGADVVAFANNFRNCPGSFGRCHCRGADRNHWRGPATASRAFPRCRGEICIRRAESPHVFGAQGAGRV